MPKEVIGLTGVTASGKTTVARVLEHFGFNYTSLRDAVKRELIERGMPITRENLKFLEDELVRRQGKSVLAVLARSFIISSGEPYWVVEGITNQHQVAEFRKLPSFFLVGVNAPIQAISARMRKRRRRADPFSTAELTAHIDRELADSEGGLYWNVGRCLELADSIIDNNVEFSEHMDIKETELYARIERMLRRKGSFASQWKVLEKS